MKLLHLSIALFGLSLLLLYTNGKSVSPKTIPNTSSAHDLPPSEIVSTPSASLTTTPPDVTAQGVFIIDANSHTVLYQKNADERLAPASTTKMMTALVASEIYNLNTVVTVPDFTVEGQKMDVFSGEQLSIQSLLYGTLVDSANDAAEVLSRFYPEGRQSFIDYMNIKAKNLGMMNTTFRNPTGLDDPAHMTTARDMSILGEVVMEHPMLRKIVGTTSASVSSVNGKSVHYFKATNMLLSTVEGVQGIKTGWTEAAHENLVTYIVRNNHPVIISLLGSNDRFGETKKLIEWVYSGTQW